MSVVTVVVTLAMLAWAVAFVAIGLRQGIRLLRRSASAGAPPPGEKAGVVILFGVFGVLVLVALVVGALVTEREADLVGLGPKIARLEARERAYDEAVRRLDRALEAGAKAPDASVDRLAADVRKELAALRERLGSRK
jgi:hypothetical protein